MGSTIALACSKDGLAEFACGAEKAASKEVSSISKAANHPSASTMSSMGSADSLCTIATETAPDYKDIGFDRYDDRLGIFM